EHGTVDLIDLNNINMDELEYGKVQAQCGRGSYEYIEKSVQLALKDEVKALATTPINKESLEMANDTYISKNEMLEDLADTEDQLKMFKVNDIRIFFLKRHLSVKDSIDQMTKERVSDYIDRCDKALQRLGIENRKIAVAGLNPHSGEGGLLVWKKLKKSHQVLKQHKKQDLT